jgi:hypothetical protein
MPARRRIALLPCDLVKGGLAPTPDAPPALHSIFTLQQKAATLSTGAGSTPVSELDPATLCAAQLLCSLLDTAPLPPPSTTPTAVVGPSKSKSLMDQAVPELKKRFSEGDLRGAMELLRMGGWLTPGVGGTTSLLLSAQFTHFLGGSSEWRAPPDVLASASKVCALLAAQLQRWRARCDAAAAAADQGADMVVAADAAFRSLLQATPRPLQEQMAVVWPQLSCFESAALLTGRGGESSEGQHGGSGLQAAAAGGDKEEDADALLELDLAAPGVEVPSALVAALLPNLAANTLRLGVRHVGNARLEDPTLPQDVSHALVLEVRPGAMPLALPALPSPPTSTAPRNAGGGVTGAVAGAIANPFGSVPLPPAADRQPGLTLQLAKELCDAVLEAGEERERGEGGVQAAGSAGGRLAMLLVSGRVTWAAPHLAPYILGGGDTKARSMNMSACRLLCPVPACSNRIQSYSVDH